MKVSAHAGDVMAVSFNPFQEHLLLSAGTDKIVKLWDTRSFKEPVHSFEQHNDDVIGVSWAPFNESVFASSSADRRVFVWDCSRIGQEQSEEDAEDGPPELLVRCHT
jgi:histone-binding protein RBBP4